ncbi:forkhead box protein A1-like [Gigantopelta aegis]|uniref:forkhead box protein A1-like n=1 Tax=Gigantopelta aegis TaxID=1735272 RepID=UPI001B887457|nr:forkhead box protein A1-like [Gigantopelta aegis]
MCSSEQNILMSSYGMKMANLVPYFQFFPSSGQLSALDFQRFQMLNHGPKIQFGMRGYPSTLGVLPYSAGHMMDPYAQACFYKHDLRAGFIQEEPKPNYSYIALISMAILGSKEEKLVLGDIYQWILDNYSYFRTRGTGWRNSIRHNLSLNECFVKCGRSANGKGHYWAVHEANVDDFKQGDFRRRRAQRKVRRYMGLSFPGEDDDDSLCSSPTPTPNWAGRSPEDRERQSLSSPSAASSSPRSSASPDKEMDNAEVTELSESVNKHAFHSNESNGHSDTSVECEEELGKEEKTQNLRESVLKMKDEKNPQMMTRVIAQPPKKRLFDIESLLAPDTKRVCIQARTNVLSADSKLQWTKLWTVYHNQFAPTELDVVT